jgi:hypothetical protein
MFTDSEFKIEEYVDETHPFPWRHSFEDIFTKQYEVELLVKETATIWDTHVKTSELVY